MVGMGVGFNVVELISCWFLRNPDQWGRKKTIWGCALDPQRKGNGKVGPMGLRESGWAIAKDSGLTCAIIIIPIFMAFSRAKMGEAKDYATTFISRAFLALANTLCTILAANEIEECGDDPLPWGIMIKGLTYQDAATLLHHQLWFSKTFSFSAHPATNFTSDWLGNWDFAATAKDTSAALECLKATLSHPDTTIGRYLAEKVPDQLERRAIIDSTRVQPTNLSTGPS
ncbi:uncharacterized protein EI90DRAFT_3014045 [Cantharellus anzutake]|uniref:uncharacterized protein n=1 Tax=Cantharellus anzutake TaxID=1750568 RepID=UPI001902F181|nr:uncharacterized protein EI90DRAFT_3014045 [Cantharellus anzutake]KAF8337108.1 hypothetical protein EI90DRAFT_3014045 [Cantharellus anzutake]